jgi:arginine exporter protein ArgO
VGKWDRKGKTADKRFIIKQITTVVDWILISLGISGIQYKIHASGFSYLWVRELGYLYIDSPVLVEKSSSKWY